MIACGKVWSVTQPSSEPFHQCARPDGHSGAHECECILSGTPAGGPGVLEDGGSAAGEPHPPRAAGDLTADPPSPPKTAETGEAAADAPSAVDPVSVETDDGAGAPPQSLSTAAAEAIGTPAPSSLTAEMQVARCRVLLDQWRKDRLGKPADHTTVGYAESAAIKRCETELREALEGP